MTVSKLVSAHDAVSVIQTGDNVASSGWGGHGVAESVLRAIEERLPGRNVSYHRRCRTMRQTWRTSGGSILRWGLRCRCSDRMAVPVTGVNDFGDLEEGLDIAGVHVLQGPVDPVGSPATEHTSNHQLITEL